MQTLKKIHGFLFWLIIITMIAWSCIGWKLAYEDDLILSSHFLSGDGFSRGLEFKALQRLYLVSYINSATLLIAAIVLASARLTKIQKSTQHASHSPGIADK
ncbi:MAG: hypothetical protein WCJ07_08935 [Verrucomicrobiota bacterium]